jgi:glucose-6-phosphate 1-epimerase
VVWTHTGPASPEVPGSVSARFTLSGPGIPDAFPRTLSLVYNVVLDDKSLTTSLTVCNAGSEPFKFKALFHNYFAVENSQKVKVSGFEEKQGYVDNLKGGSKEVWAGGEVTMQVETGKYVPRIMHGTMC